MPKEKGETALKDLKRMGLFCPEYRILHSNGSILIPVSSPANRLPDYMETVDVIPEPRREKNYPRKHSGSFDVIGSIAVIKVKSMERAVQISESIYGSNRAITSVYYAGSVGSDFRTRHLTLLAGKEGTVTVHRENGMRFKVDISRVYFSPRLATERSIVASSVQDGEQVLDLFAGVGPFSITIAEKSKCTVDAVDINPAAVELMKENISMNRLRGEVRPFLSDAADFLSRSSQKYDRIIMNLPMESEKFLNSATDHLKDGGIMHYYVIADLAGLVDTMKSLNDAGLILINKRIVHGYSREKNMYSLTLRRI
ncbi:MAG: class I SAM-dependent methyltransferase family protein [Candidatus Thermoplasmatota archaeon]|nr:class I SAM-dependent methyltransferase family protein [Candidatus Thermoplasmatota archaeon]